MVGRARELRQLCERVGARGLRASCQLFTILGAAGVGKSRLAAEFLAAREDAARSCAAAASRTARASPTGPSWRSSSSCPRSRPIRARGRDDSRPPRRSAARHRQRGDRLGVPQAAGGVAARAAARLCLRRPALGRSRPSSTWSSTWPTSRRDAPILLLCMARPDLLDRRTGWGGGKVNATTVLLEPLAPEETALLIESLAHAGRTPARPDPGGRRGQPALRRGDGRAAARSPATARWPSRRRSRRCSRPASTSSSPHERNVLAVRLGRGADVPPRRGAGAEPGRDAAWRRT